MWQAGWNGRVEDEHASRVEVLRPGDRHQAVFRAMNELFLPGAIGVLADAAGILVLGVATIPLIRKLAFFASFWGFSNIFTILILVMVFRPTGLLGSSLGEKV